MGKRLEKIRETALVIGQQHCCWESLRDYSFVKLKLQQSQTELLSRSVDNSFLAMGVMGVMGGDGN